MNCREIIIPTGFEYKDCGLKIFSQTVCKHTTSRTRTNNNIVIHSRFFLLCNLETSLGRHLFSFTQRAGDRLRPSHTSPQWPSQLGDPALVLSRADGSLQR